MAKRAIIIVDVQNEYFEGPMTIQYPAPADSLATIIKVLDKANEADIPVAEIRHFLPSEAPIFAEGSKGVETHPEVAARRKESWTSSTKAVASALQDSALRDWLKANEVDTLTLIGYMTNNCVFGTAYDAENFGFKAEVLSDATGAIHMKNAAGEAEAKLVHETLMTVLHSNLVAVTTYDQWAAAVDAGENLPQSNLVETAIAGAERFA